MNVCVKSNLSEFLFDDSDDDNNQRGLRPFFSYFGSKYRLASLYPAPQHDMIIEPFAGAAGYSLLYPHYDVSLYDTYEPIVELWDYLIHVSEAELLSLPLGPFTKDNPIDCQPIANAAKHLIGLWATESQTSPSRYPQSPSRGGNWTERKRALIASQLQYIRHWTAELKSYEEIDNQQQATYFIDSPYQIAGKRYRKNCIDYAHLGRWSKRCNGQVIVCEQQGADWLEFAVLQQTRNGSNKNYTEVIWLNSDEMPAAANDNVQRPHLDEFLS